MLVKGATDVGNPGLAAIESSMMVYLILSQLIGARGLFLLRWINFNLCMDK